MLTSGVSRSVSLSDWGWNGLLNFAIIDQYRERPAWATGITQTGGVSEVCSGRSCSAGSLLTPPTARRGSPSPPPVPPLRP